MRSSSWSDIVGNRFLSKLKRFEVFLSESACWPIFVRRRIFSILLRLQGSWASTA